MDDRSDLFLDRKQLAQILYSLRDIHLTAFRNLFPTPILDTQIESALKVATKYSLTEKNTKPRATSHIKVSERILQAQEQRKAKKKMQNK